MCRSDRNWRLTAAIPLAILLFFVTNTAFAESKPAIGKGSRLQSTLETLNSFVDLRTNLKKDIEDLNRQLTSAQTEEAEKNNLKRQLAKLRDELRITKRNFEDISAGVDISSLRAETEEKFNFQQEIFALLKPALDEMKEMTAHVRQKSELKGKIGFYEERLPIMKKALKNINNLQEQTENKALNTTLQETALSWKKKQAFMQSELQAAQLHLSKLLESETSLTEASQSYFKSFFQKRGLYLIEAVLLVAAILLLSRFSYAGMRRFMPGFRKKHRSFRIRLIELLHRVFTILLTILGPMIVFYLVEDWVLFSLGILLLLGIAWTLRQALPRYWHQIQLFLNIGSVREGERIAMEGLPWLVEEINVYSRLVNPTADISQRVPIDDLVDLKSRPSRPHEPWFPCKEGDWVILSDGVRGKVTGISHELVQLVQRGGAQMTYQTSDFLANSPRNLATNFRIKEILGISYSLQSDSTTSIPETLHRYIEQRAADEGYGEKMLNLRVEFNQANSSSLDLVVIADFDGQLGDLYNRLRRAIQRWCVDASTEYGWEIPFPQMTLHGPHAGTTETTASGEN